jgi:NADPH-dependent ferric siderophore reductase
MSDEETEHPFVPAPTRIFHARVLRRGMVTPHMAEVTLVGDDLIGLPDLGPDAFIYVFIPHAGEAAPRVPYDFSWEDWRNTAPEERAVGRYYTIRRRRPEAGEIDLHMVLHGEGPLTSWAARATPGDRVALWGPRAAWRAPEGSDWFLLAADDAGVPAAAAILESLPADAGGVALLEIGSEDARQDLIRPPGVALMYLVRDGTEPGQLLREAVCATPLPASGVYAWAAADTDTTLAIRKHLRHDRGLSGATVCAIGYWQRAAEPT